MDPFGFQSPSFKASRMAVRLSVLVLRPPGGGSTWHAHSDDLLGHLLGRPGLDLTLLERLPEANEDSTETLALESIGGHIACLAWQDAEAVMAGLDRAGRPMARRPHAGDPDCEVPAAPLDSPGPGRMYFFDMRRHGDAQEILASLQRLLQTLQVSTFQIAPRSKPAGEVNVKRVAAAPNRTSQSISSRPLPQRAEPRVHSSPSDALDRLVDELDAFEG